MTRCSQLLPRQHTSAGVALGGALMAAVPSGDIKCFTGARNVFVQPHVDPKNVRLPACWEFCADTGAAPPPPHLVGSFNESQFPTECHITPLNDLIKQSRHSLSPAISLFTTASTAVTQFSPLPTPPPPRPQASAGTRSRSRGISKPL